MKLREISAEQIKIAVKELFIEANTVLPEDLVNRIYSCEKCEKSAFAKACFEDMISNFKLAERDALPICQDTGIAVVFIEIGQDVHINGDFTDAINAGVREAYQEGCFRCSVVKDPIFRENTGDNTPAVIHKSIVKVTE